MFDAAQILYLEEVLGTSVRSYLAVPAPKSGVAVLAPDMSPEDEALLKKIMASVGLDRFEVHDRLPAGAAFAHVIAFSGEGSGREPRAEAVWWWMPKLSAMQGSDPQVASLKREAWQLLQQFKKERG